MGGRRERRCVGHLPWWRGSCRTQHRARAGLKPPGRNGVASARSFRGGRKRLRCPAPLGESCGSGLRLRISTALTVLPESCGQNRLRSKAGRVGGPGVRIRFWWPRWCWRTYGYMNRVHFEASRNVGGRIRMGLQTGGHAPTMAGHYQDPPSRRRHLRGSGAGVDRKHRVELPWRRNQYWREARDSGSSVPDSRATLRYSLAGPAANRCDQRTMIRGA